MTSPEAPQAKPDRGGALSFRIVAVGSAVLGGLIVAVAVALYLRFVRYDRIAARHVPPGVAFAVRLDVEQALLYEPVRRHLLPLLGGPLLPPNAAAARLKWIEAHTDIERGDLREIVLARGATRADWVLILGGLFPVAPGAAAIAQLLAEEVAGWAPTPDGEAAVHRPSGVALGRARDGAVLLASSERLLRVSLEPGGGAAALGLAATGPGELVLLDTAVAELAAQRWPAAAGDLPALYRRLERLSARVELGERVGVTVTLTAAEPGAAKSTADQTFAVLRAIARADSEAVILRAGVDRMRVEAAGERVASVHTEWEREEVDRAFEGVADAIRAGFRPVPVLTRP